LIAAVGFDERRIVKALGFEFRKSGISFLFHVKNKVVAARSGAKVWLRRGRMIFLWKVPSAARRRTGPD
jgi:hypothetical protein